ncbi:MAG: type I methionyl aminopeptidase [Candidatus Susulua stagnicola]|nr:type I methionyl aminopeptidase [Candidatus Susulua stagnicola]
MIEPLSRQDLEKMRKAGKVAAMVLKKLKSFIKPGSSTKDIEEFFEQEISKYPGMEAAFKGFMDYPASCCVSINEEIIHGIPSQKLIKSGDLVSVDLGIKYQGLFVDTAYTYAIGKVSSLGKRLIKATKKSLKQGISQIRVGKRVGDISSVIQKHVEKNGFSVVRRFVGHGIGRDLHLPPEVPNFGDPNCGEELLEGFVIAVEPMVSSGDFNVDVLSDGWTAKTKDNSLSAHFEHTIAITKKGPWVLTA